MKNKKNYRIITTAIAVVVMVIWMTSWAQKQNSGLKNSEVFVTETVEAEMKHVINLLDKEDYEALQELADDTMKEFVSEEVLGDAKTQISENWGSLEKLGKIYLSEAEQDGNPMVGGQVKAVYENVKVTYMIVFDQEMKLAGLYIK